MTSIMQAPASFDITMAKINNDKSIDPATLAKTKAAAQDFEAMFASEMMSHMFEGIDADPMFGGGQGEEMFKSLLINEYGKEMAKGPGLGISNQIQQMMIQMQQQKGV